MKHKSTFPSFFAPHHLRVLTVVFFQKFPISCIFAIMTKSSSSPTRIENFTPEEKIVLISIFKKRLLIKSMIYVFIILISISILIYTLCFTSESENFVLLYFAMGITVALCGRMFIADLSEYQRETSSPVKKVVNTRILHRDEKTIYIGNQRFRRKDIILDASEFDELHAGDPVRVEHSVKSHIIFSVKKI
jgi:hypothetical protein